MPSLIHKNWHPFVEDWYRAWVASSDKDSSMNQFLLQYELIATFLKFHGIKYYFFNAIIPAYIPKVNYLHEVLDNTPNERVIESMRTDPGFLDPFNEDSTFWNILRKKYDGHKDGRWGHFTEDAHAEWADFLIERIEQLYPNLLIKHD
jgi:hypothetical protein